MMTIIYFTNQEENHWLKFSIFPVSKHQPRTGTQLPLEKPHSVYTATELRENTHGFVWNQHINRLPISALHLPLIVSVLHSSFPSNPLLPSMTPSKSLRKSLAWRPPHLHASTLHACAAPLSMETCPSPPAGRDQPNLRGCLVASSSYSPSNRWNRNRCRVLWEKTGSDIDSVTRIRLGWCKSNPREPTTQWCSLNEQGAASIWQ